MKNFFGLFAKKPTFLKEAIDLSILSTDLHSHLIPGIDDGAKTMDDALFLVKHMIDLGYKKLITTPHIQYDYYKNTPENINAGFEMLKKALVDNNLTIEIEVAAEYLVDDGFIEKVEKDQILTFNNKYILIELPYTYEPPNLNNALFELQTRGYRVVLAHPERYGYWHQDLSKYEELHQRGILLQMNINSLTGWYSKESKKIAEHLIEKKIISFLGSDMHNENYMEQLKNSRFEISLKKAIETNPIKNSIL